MKKKQPFRGSNERRCRRAVASARTERATWDKRWQGIAYMKKMGYKDPIKAYEDTVK